MSPESEREGASEQLRKLNKEFWDTMWMMFKKMSTRKFKIVLCHLWWRNNDVIENDSIDYDVISFLLLDTMKIGMKYGREIKNKAEKVRFEMIL